MNAPTGRRMSNLQQHDAAHNMHAVDHTTQMLLHQLDVGGVPQPSLSGRLPAVAAPAAAAAAPATPATTATQPVVDEAGSIPLPSLPQLPASQSTQLDQRDLMRDLASPMLVNTQLAASMHNAAGSKDSLAHASESPACVLDAPFGDGGESPTSHYGNVTGPASGVSNNAGVSLDASSTEGQGAAAPLATQPSHTRPAAAPRSPARMVGVTAANLRRPSAEPHRLAGRSSSASIPQSASAGDMASVPEQKKPRGFFKRALKGLTKRAPKHAEVGHKGEDRPKKGKADESCKVM